MKRKWYEIWADDGLEFPYLLMVVPEDDREGVVVIDTKEAGRASCTSIYRLRGGEDVATGG